MVPSPSGRAAGGEGYSRCLSGEGPGVRAVRAPFGSKDHKRSSSVTCRGLVGNAQGNALVVTHKSRWLAPEGPLTVAQRFIAGSRNAKKTHLSRRDNCTPGQRSGRRPMRCKSRFSSPCKHPHEKNNKRLPPCQDPGRTRLISAIRLLASRVGQCDRSRLVAVRARRRCYSGTCRKTDELTRRG